MTKQKEAAATEDHALRHALEDGSGGDPHAGHVNAGRPPDSARARQGAHADHGPHRGHGAHDAHRSDAGSATHVDDGSGTGHGTHAGHGSDPGHGQMGYGGHSAHGHGGGHGDHVAMFRDRFWLTLGLSIPVILFSEMFQMLLGYQAPQFPGSGLIAPVLGTVIFFYGGAPFLKGGLDEARTRRPGMMLLIALAISVAFIASLATEAGFFHLDFWWELAALIAIMLLGHWQEMKAIGQASDALGALAELLPDGAERLTETGSEMVPLSDLRRGDIVLVRPGGRVPADGTVVDGSADVDESMLTGESRPVAKAPGNKVVAGTVSTDSSLKVRVEAVGEQTALAGIQRLVEEAQASRSKAQALADKAAALLFYVAAGAGILTFVIWNALGDSMTAVERTVTVLVIACPHALGLAIPLVISISTAVSARNGILVKDRLALERMRSVDVVLFDKTGTLTAAEHVVTDVASYGMPEDQVLALAAAVEVESEHPMAKAVVRSASDQGRIPQATSFRALTGRGVEAEVEGRRISVGGPALLRQFGAEVPEALGPSVAQWQKRGASIIYVVDSGRPVGALALEDRVRPESRRAVEELHKAGVRVAMITGDAREVAEAVSRDLGIDEYFAEVLPEDKEAKVAELQRRGHKVAMVGDGVNDAPALARAEVGIAIGAGTDVAIESAGVVLASDDPRAVVSVIRLSKSAYRKMVQNLLWATGYNAFAIPAAAGLFAWAGITLSPAAGAVLMSVSTIVVAFNAQLLRRVDLKVS
ncbi:MAG TPA: copper-translocating P-type ATPase [Actinomycetota bacterium]|nr:copper-translocating P-type ATPase [Actinomycetota bacterium]